MREKQYRDRDKIGHIERKVFQCADRWRVLEPTSPSTEEKQSLRLNSWMGKAAAVGRTPNVHSDLPPHVAAPEAEQSLKIPAKM